MKDKFASFCAWLGIFTAFFMFGAPVQQVLLNLKGDPGPVLPMIAMAINCALWTGYALLKRERDWKIAAPNILGFFVGLAGALSVVLR